MFLLFLGIFLLTLIVTISSSLEICPLGNLPLNIKVPWQSPTPLPPIRFPLPLASPQMPPYHTNSPPYVPMSPEYHLASLTPPPSSPPLEAILSSPSITSPQGLSLEDISLPPLNCQSSNQVKGKFASKKRNVQQHLRLHLKKVYKDFLKGFTVEEVEKEVLEQLGHSLKGKHSSRPYKACLSGDWCGNYYTYKAKMMGPSEL